MAEGRPERGSEKMNQMMSSINNMGCMMMQKGMDKGEFMQGSVARLANLSPDLAKLANFGRLIAILILQCIWLFLNPNMLVLASAFRLFLTLFKPILAKFTP